MDRNVVGALVRTIELKDASTAAHTWRVVLYARALAEVLGVDHDRIERITIGAALHDIGKIDVPDDVLKKPGRLTDSEYALIQSHAISGYDRLRRMGEEDPIVLELVRHHHERWDGRGYPDGIAEDAIPLAPRFFSVIDSFDAMTSLRPYRSEIGADAARRAIAELESGAGTRYWPEAVDAFARLHRSGALEWILHYYNDEVPVPSFEVGANARGAGPTAPR